MPQLDRRVASSKTTPFLILKSPCCCFMEDSGTLVTRVLNLGCPKPQHHRQSFSRAGTLILGPGAQDNTTSCTSVMSTLSQVHRQPRKKSIMIQLSRRRLGQQMGRLARRLTPAGPPQTLSFNVSFHNHLSHTWNMCLSQR